MILDLDTELNAILRIYNYMMQFQLKNFAIMFIPSSYITSKRMKLLADLLDA